MVYSYMHAWPLAEHGDFVIIDILVTQQKTIK